MSGLTEYAAGSKRHWRGWQWNRITERLTVPPAEARVLYLTGPDDFDRENRWWEHEPDVRAEGIAEARRKIAACRAVRTARLRSA